MAEHWNWWDRHRPVVAPGERPPFGNDQIPLFVRTLRISATGARLHLHKPRQPTTRIFFAHRSDKKILLATETPRGANHRDKHNHEN